MVAGGNPHHLTAYGNVGLHDVLFEVLVEALGRLLFHSAYGNVRDVCLGPW